MRALFDMLFPATCAGCRREGAVVCTECVAVLHATPQLRLPTPCPDGLPPSYAVGDYSGTTRALLLAYKERDAVALTSVLATALASAIDAASTDLLGAQQQLVVVPVPSTRAALRRRGYDPVLRIARAARRGEVVPALAHVRDIQDSAGLSAAARRHNLTGALAVPVRMRDRLAGRSVVLVDDVVTTGTTLVEAARALRVAGVGVTAAAVVAATVRRGLAPADLPKEGSQHYCS